MRAKDAKLARQLATALGWFDRQTLPLPGIRNAARRDALIEQLVESILTKEKRIIDIMGEIKKVLAGAGK